MKKMLSVITIIVFVTTSAYCGWLDNVGKKAEQRIEDRSKAKVENQINKAADAVVDKSFDAAGNAVTDAVNSDNKTETSNKNERTEADNDPWGN